MIHWLSSECVMQKLLGEGFLTAAKSHVTDVAGFVFVVCDDCAHLSADDRVDIGNVKQTLY